MSKRTATKLLTPLVFISAIWKLRLIFKHRRLINAAHHRIVDMSAFELTLPSGATWTGLELAEAVRVQADRMELQPLGFERIENYLFAEWRQGFIAPCDTKELDRLGPMGARWWLTEKGNQRSGQRSRRLLEAIGLPH